MSTGSVSGFVLLTLQRSLALQRAYVRALADACVDQGHPELIAMVTTEALIEINAIRAQIDALLFPGRRWAEVLH